MYKKYVIYSIYNTHTHTTEYNSAIKKQGYAVFYNFGLWGHYAKWNKVRRHIPYDLTYTWSLKQNQTECQTHRKSSDLQI